MTKLPKITFRLMTFIENMDLMAMFIHDELNQEDKANIIFFKDKYPEIKDIDFSKMTQEQISDFLQSKLSISWHEEMKSSDNIVNDFQSNWDQINDDVMRDLANRLNIDWPEDSLNILARVGIMAACPRYVEERVYDTYIYADVARMRVTAIHEICHFLYFEKWQELLGNYWGEGCDNPHIVWLLSEAMIDPLLNNDVFRKYTNAEIFSYDVFYNTMINDASIIDYLREIVINKPIDEAIKDSYAFFMENQQIINPNTHI